MGKIWKMCSPIKRVRALWVAPKTKKKTKNKEQRDKEERKTKTEKEKSVLIIHIIDSTDGKKNLVKTFFVILCENGCRYRNSYTKKKHPTTGK